MHKSIRLLIVILSIQMLYAPITITSAESDAVATEIKATSVATRNVSSKKHTTFIVFMAADNDLHHYAWHNIEQMKKIGSNEHINIVAQINSPGASIPTRRFYIQQNSMQLVSPVAGTTASKYNSGSAQTLVDCVQWAASNYPAEHYVLILWDHATGILEPGRYRATNSSDQFLKNQENNRHGIDRNTEIVQQTAHQNKRAVCFDDTFKSYITNQEIGFALKEIHHNVLKKPLDIIGFDACLMGMVEVASIVKSNATFMVASQDIEYGNGCNYTKMLRPFLTAPLEPKELAEHMVRAYDEEYRPIASDFTQSAFQLSVTTTLEENINTVAQLLSVLFIETKSKNIRNLVKLCKSAQYCTCFDEPSYIDLCHFYKNLIKYIPYVQLNNQDQGKLLLERLNAVLQQGVEIINQLVIQNAAGSGLKNAHGVSIYFPEYRLSGSYLQSNFGANNAWSSFLHLYLSS
jgi:hypothetical protein